MTRIKRISLFAVVMLCMATFILPMTAFAATDKDTTPPTLSAKLDGGTLNVEASDDVSGVEAVYVDGNRINTLIDGKASVILRDYAGNNKQVSVYAVDYAGNRSATVKIDNPYYVAPTPLPAASAPASTSTPAPTTPQASSSAASSSSATSTPAASTSTPASSDNSGSDSTSGSSESAIDEGDTVFTPEGTGTVVDIATDEDGKLFYTIVTPAGNVFYLVIDLARTDGNNVYFLNAVTEADLAALAETDGSTTGNESAIPTPEPEPTPTPDPEPEPTPEPEPEEKGGGMGTIFLVLLAVAAIGGAGWYFKIYKPKQEAAFMDDMDEDESEGEDDEEDEIAFENENDGDEDYDEQEAEAYQAGDGTGTDED